MLELPIEVHDTSHMHTPFPAAVSRVTLRTWCHNPHPKSVHFIHKPQPLVRCMVDAMAWVKAEAPGFAHGMLIHGIQKQKGGPILPPTFSTLRQYAARRTALGTAVFSPRPHAEPEHILLYDLDADYRTAPWVWHALVASLLHKIEVVGEPPQQL